MGLIFYASSQTAPPYHLPLPYDKLMHLLEYAVLGLLLIRAIYKTFPQYNPAILSVIAIIIGALYGAGDEFHQSFVPGRNVDMLDWAADFLGTACGSLVIFRSAKGKRR